MAISFSSDLLLQIRKFNSKANIERCGLIFNVQGMQKICEVPNVHPQPRGHFAITKRHADELFIEYGTRNLIGVFHTHLKIEERNPSQRDMDQLRRMDRHLLHLVGIVYNVPLGLLVEFSSHGPMRELLVSSRGE